MRTRRPSRRWPAAILAPVVIAACAQPAPPPEPGPAPPAPPARPVTLNLENASVTEVARALAQSGERALVIDPEAQEVAGCVRITVLAPSPVPVGDAVRLVSDALAPAGLSLVEQETGLILRRKPGAPLPASCQKAQPLPEQAAAEPAEQADAAEAPKTDAEAVKKILAGIRKVGEGQYELTEQARDLLFEGVHRYTRVRVVPAMRDGQAKGMKLFAIRSGDVLSALGLLNGDTLLQVAGFQASNPEQALEAYVRVRNAPNIEVQIERKDQPVTLSYRIVPKKK